MILIALSASRDSTHTTLDSDLFAVGRDPSGVYPPYATVADPEPLNSVSRVLSCGPEWGGAALGHEANPEVPEI